MDPSEEKPSRRRPAERPVEILEAAERVFTRCGYDRATTREIAAEASVSEGTLYNYFNSKRDILFALMDFIYDELRKNNQTIHAEGVEDAFVQIIAGRLRFAQKHPLTILSLQQVMLDPEIGHYFDRQVSEGQDQMMAVFKSLFDAGVLRTVDPFVAEEALGSMMMGLTIGIELASRGFHRDPLEPEEIARGLVDVLMNGLRVKS
jgi:AcrR family transcriptional regulator